MYVIQASIHVPGSKGKLRCNQCVTWLGWSLCTLGRSTGNCQKCHKLVPYRTIDDFSNLVTFESISCHHLLFPQCMVGAVLEGWAKLNVKLTCASPYHEVTSLVRNRTQRWLNIFKRNSQLQTCSALCTDHTEIRFRSLLELDWSSVIFLKMSVFLL